VLVPCFVVARALGKWLATGAARRALVRARVDVSAFPERRETIVPLSALALALVVSVQALYGDDTIQWILTAIIGATAVTEVLVHFTGGDRAPPRAPAHLAGPERALALATPLPPTAVDDAPTEPTPGPFEEGAS
jgi:hypothetical protein